MKNKSWFVKKEYRVKVPRGKKLEKERKERFGKWTMDGSFRWNKKKENCSSVTLENRKWDKPEEIQVQK